jgi:hypothetical protein
VSFNKSSLVGWIIVALFLFGMIQLMLLRFSAGDVYPLYSSLRSDPLGTKAFYESLEICCPFQVERNYEPFSRVKNRFDSTFFVLGLPDQALGSVPKEVSEEINYFISGGGRLVISLHPSKVEISSLRVEQDESREFIDLTDEWGIRLFREERITGSGYRTEDFHVSGLPDKIQTHNRLYFQTIDPGWRTVYQRAHHPVIIERKLGRGSLVLSAESYFLSNEAMVKDRYPALLTWFTGEPATVIFDEYHHGIAANAGVMYLARKYNLEWLFGMILVLALLFIWKNTVPLVPPNIETADSLQVGKESIAGLTNLLRRNIPAQQLLPVCYAEWQKTSKNTSEQTRKAMEAIVSSESSKRRTKDLPSAYNAISRALNSPQKAPGTQSKKR